MEHILKEKLHILMLEDIPADAGLILRELRREGLAFSARRVETEAAFTAALREFTPDLILSDYSLPHYDGLSALKAAQAERPEVPFIMVSGTLGEEQAVETMQRGATDYILKQRLERLGPAVARALKEAEDRRERRRAEEQVRKLSRAVEQNSVSIIITDARGDIEYVNPRFSEVTGYAPEEVIGKSPRILKSGETPPETYRGMWETITAGREWRGEFLNKKKNGELYWDAALISPLKDAQGNITHYVANQEDITGRKRAEEEVRQQFRRISLLNQIARAIAERQDLRSIFHAVLQHLEDHLPADFSGVFLCVPETDALTVAARGPKSQALAVELGTSESISFAVEQIGLGPCLKGETAYFPDMREMDAPILQRMAQAGLRSGVATPLVVGDRTIGVLTVARRQVDGFSGGEGEFLRTLSEHVALAARHAQLYQNLQNAYEDLRQTRQAVMQQERLKALGQMASGIAHDINNALSPVLGYAQMLLLDKEKLGQDQVQYLNIIQQSARDITQIVARMREFYRHREAQEALLPVRLNEVVKQVIDLTRPRWRDMSQARGVEIGLQTDLREGLPPMMGVESEVREALTNLVFNAVDAMPQGGTLTIKTRQHETEKRRNGETGKGPLSDSLPPPFSGSGVGGWVEVEVADTGVGMDEETRQRCLEPFYSTKGERGTGLGLAMVFGTMQRHEGRIEVESEAGRGTTVRLIFPVRRPDARPGVPPEELGGYAGPPLRVLCIDDEPLLRSLVKRMLEKDGHAAEVADGGQAGLDAFRAARGRGEPFDVVLTDLGMPHIGGREVVRTVKRESPDTPVILLTGWGSPLDEEGKIPVQVDYMMSKPPEVHALRRALEQVCARKG